MNFYGAIDLYHVREEAVYFDETKKEFKGNDLSEDGKKKLFSEDHFRLFLEWSGQTEEMLFKIQKISQTNIPKLKNSNFVKKTLVDKSKKFLNLFETAKSSPDCKTNENGQPFEMRYRK